MARRNKSKGWALLYIFAGGMDFIQLVIIEGILVWFAGLGAVINEILDPIVGIFIALWIQFGKKVSLFSRPKRIISLVGTEAAGALTGGIAQLWILDVWYIHNDVKKEEAELKAQEEEARMQNPMEQSINEDGSRNPTSPRSPLNQGGVRKPISINQATKGIQSPRGNPPLLNSVKTPPRIPTRI